MATQTHAGGCFFVVSHFTFALTCGFIVMLHWGENFQFFVAGFLKAIKKVRCREQTENLFRKCYFRFLLLRFPSLEFLI